MTDPRPLPQILRRLPPPPLAPRMMGLALSALLRRIAAQKPSFLSRLGPYEGTRFLIDVTDGPVLLMMEPKARRITVHRRGAAPAHDAAITGRLAAFLAMLHGIEDGDALFFSGALEITGDTSAVLALRNALDDAELDLTSELAGLIGRPFGPWLRRASTLAEQRTGYAFSRQEVMP